MEISELPDGVLQGHSPALNLHLRWVAGELEFHDPATGQPIATFESERSRADRERARADNAETERNAERVVRNAERARADRAEARVRQLEERLGRRTS